MPVRGAMRDMYVDRLVNVIIEEPKGDADPHWTKKGRAALNGFIHFLVSKCESGNYDGVPDQWYGEEPSLPMLLDWITEATLAAGDQIEALRAEDPNAALFADPIRNFLMNAVNEARQNDYAPRSILELTQLANTPDKERGSILSTMDAGLTIFKNDAVRGRTAKSDFSFLDIRGIQDPETGKMMPMTIYISVSSEDAKALSVITGLFVETLSAWLIAHKPGGTTRDGRKVGPFPVMFVLDEFPQMPKLQALIDGPAVGRGQKVSYLLIGQDLGQITAVYGKDQTETIISTTAAKIVLPLNNENTAKRFSEMIGNETIRDWSDNRSEGLTKNANPFARQRTVSFKSSSLVGVSNLMSLAWGTHLVIWQGYAKNPIKCKTPMYFKHPKLKKLVNPENGGRYPPAPPMPYWMVERRLMEEGYIEAPMDRDDDDDFDTGVVNRGDDDRDTSADFRRVE
jgi:type IV secretion system protein VirD4